MARSAANGAFQLLIMSGAHRFPVSALYRQLASLYVKFESATLTEGGRFPRATFERSETGASGEKRTRKLRTVLSTSHGAIGAFFFFNGSTQADALVREADGMLLLIRAGAKQDVTGLRVTGGQYRSRYFSYVSHSLSRHIQTCRIFCQRSAEKRGLRPFFPSVYS
jgi:hypothetical protein